MISRNPSKRGFTLIELLVVISIIGMLVAVAAVSFSQVQRRSRDSRRIQDMESMQKAMELYASVGVGAVGGKGQYPTGAPSATTLGLQSLPVDPLNSGTSVYAWNTPTATTYCFCALLESASGGNFNSNACGGAGTTHYCVQNQQ